MKLADYLSQNDIKPSKFAALIGVSPQTITGWCNNDFWIGHDNAKRIFEITNGAVTPTDFLKADGAAQ